MEIPKIITNRTLQLAALLVLFGVIFRLTPHEANFAPISAIALLGGALLGWRYALAIPLVIMVISDSIIGTYSSMAFTWLALVLIAAYGTLFRGATVSTRVILGSLGSAVIFFIVSNFGVWVLGGMYPPTLAGIIECYSMAIPFFRATLISDVMFSGIFFGAVAWATQAQRLTPARHV